MSLSIQSVFTSRPFRLFYCGQALSYVGDGLRTIAIPLLVYHLTGSASALGVTYAIEFFGFALFGLVGGSLADRLDRRKLLITSDFVRCAIMVAWAIAYARGVLALWMIYFGLAVMSLCAAVFMGGQASSIPFLLGKERATRAVAALTAAEQTAMLVMPPLGGALFALVGPLPALIANAATYLGSQVSVALVATLGPSQPSGVPSWRGAVADVRAGFVFLWADTAMRQLTLLGLCFNFFGLMTAAVLIPFLKINFGASDFVVGISLGAFAVGAIIGSVVAGGLPARFPVGRLLAIAFALDAVLFIPVMFARDLRVVVVFMALANAAGVFEIAQIVGWRMRVIPEELVGRVFGAARFVVLIAAAPGSIIGGVLADRCGPRLPMIISGVGYIVLAAIVWLLPAVLREDR